MPRTRDKNGWACAALSRRWVMSISRVCGSCIGADRATTRIAIAAATTGCVLANATLCMGTASAQSAGKKGPPKPATTEVTSEDLLRNIACLEQRLRTLEEGKAGGDMPRPAGVESGKQDPCSVTTGKPWITTTTTEHLTLKVEPPPPTGGKEVLASPPPPIEGISFGAYGEIKFGRRQNPDAGRQWQTGFDAARVVLSPTYAITKNIIFNAELE